MDTGKEEIYYRVSVLEFDGRWYVKKARLRKHEANKVAGLFREQGQKSLVIPCARTREKQKL